MSQGENGSCHHLNPTCTDPTVGKHWGAQALVLIFGPCFVREQAPKAVLANFRWSIQLLGKYGMCLTLEFQRFVSLL